MKLDDALAVLRETRAQMREARKAFEASLEEDMADSLAGPMPEEAVEAEESTDPVIVNTGGEKWRAQFERNWSQGKKRKRWLPWAYRR